MAPVTNRVGPGGLGWHLRPIGRGQLIGWGQMGWDGGMASVADRAGSGWGQVGWDGGRAPVANRAGPGGLGWHL
eukprot:1193847-Prorocentrum_minimum.AAC.8